MFRKKKQIITFKNLLLYKFIKKPFLFDHQLILNLDLIYLKKKKNNLKNQLKVLDYVQKFLHLLQINTEGYFVYTKKLF